MDKHVLHSVLETLNAGDTCDLAFTDPYAALSGSYRILVSKVGRGRGGSRVIEVASLDNPKDTFGALEIDGVERLLGTGTSQFIRSITIGGVTHGDEEGAEPSSGGSRKAAPKAKRPGSTRSAASDEAVQTRRVLATEMNRKEPQVKGTPTKRQSKISATKAAAAAAIGAKVAASLGNILADNPNTVFKLTGRGAASPITGEWRVTSFTKEDGVLVMQCVGHSDPTKTMTFDSSTDGTSLVNAEVLFVD